VIAPISVAVSTHSPDGRNVAFTSALVWVNSATYVRSVATVHAAA
jgi:hypothetical protein